MNTIALTRLTHQTNSLLIGITGKASSILDNLGYRFRWAHLIEHGTFHITLNAHQTLVRSDNNDVVLMQTDIACQTTGENVFINVNHSNEFAATIDLDVTQCS